MDPTQYPTGTVNARVGKAQIPEKLQRAGGLPTVRPTLPHVKNQLAVERELSNGWSESVPAANDFENARVFVIAAYEC